jgi:hypothetical protein
MGCNLRLVPISLRRSGRKDDQKFDTASKAFGGLLHRCPAEFSGSGASKRHVVLHFYGPTSMWI